MNWRVWVVIVVLVALATFGAIASQMNVRS